MGTQKSSTCCIVLTSLCTCRRTRKGNREQGYWLILGSENRHQSDKTLPVVLQIAHTSAGCAIPQHISNGTLNGETKLSSSFEAVSRMAKAAAKQSGKQLLNLGEAGMRYISSQYEQWIQNGHDHVGHSYGADRYDAQVRPMVKL
jgi:hypothetical protein